MAQIEINSDPRTYAIIGAAMEVHRFLGTGFLEAVYQEALAMELASRRIPFERELALPVSYKGRILGTPCRADFLVDGVIVELKANSTLTNADRAQLLHYLRASECRNGLLINFGATSLEYKRFISPPKSAPSVQSVANPQ